MPVQACLKHDQQCCKKKYEMPIVGEIRLPLTGASKDPMPKSLGACLQDFLKKAFTPTNPFIITSNKRGTLATGGTFLVQIRMPVLIRPIRMTVIVSHNNNDIQFHKNSTTITIMVVVVLIMHPGQT